MVTHIKRNSTNILTGSLFQQSRMYLRLGVNMKTVVETSSKKVMFFLDFCKRKETKVLGYDQN